jgi:hypothetical protein
MKRDKTQNSRWLTGKFVIMDKVSDDVFNNTTCCYKILKMMMTTKVMYLV